MKDFKTVKHKTIEERLEFDRIGFHYVNIWYDKENHRGIWKMTRCTDIPEIERYELINGVKTKNPDGSISYD